MIVPSIDLMGGKVVQLKQGREKMLEVEDFLSLAKKFDRCAETAVIDLDAAMGRGGNLNIIKEVLKVAECRVGGGINSVEKARDLLALGATRVIIGSRAFEHDRVAHDFLKSLERSVGRNRLIIAIDSREREIVTKAWTHGTGLKLLDTVKELEPYASEFLFTCVEKEGCLKGTDLETIRELKKATGNSLTVAGGITTLDEVRELASLGVDCQLGMALYTGKFTLEEAFIESLDWKGGLVPTITQNEDGKVLMLAYSNKESLGKAFETGRMTYYSRSRKKLWTKGETSGNYQELVRLRADCDGDALLATVRQKGPACHTGKHSCFGHNKFISD